MNPTGLEVDLVQFGMGSGCQVRCDRHIQTPHIRPGYEGCQSAQTFEGVVWVKKS
jgi:hypothetical protein